MDQQQQELVQRMTRALSKAGFAVLLIPSAQDLPTLLDPRRTSEN
jgi:hypothetical protein